MNVVHGFVCAPPPPPLEQSKLVFALLIRSTGFICFEQGGVLIKFRREAIDLKGTPRGIFLRHADDLTSKHLS